MCMEDIRMGRDLAPIAFMQSVNNVGLVTVLGPDPMRTRIVFSTNGQDSILIGPEGITPTAFTGFLVNAAFPQMTIRIEEWGRLVTGRWQAISAAGVCGLAVMVASLEKT